MDKALADLIRISNVTGKDSTLVQGGGGNTSVKTSDGKYMYIKASGTALKDMNPKQGWRRLRLAPVLSIIEDKSLARLNAATREPEVVNRLLLACDDNIKTGARPSVEAHLHAFLDKCVIHLHPLVVAAYVNARNGRAEIEKLFKKIENRKSKIGNFLPPLWVPYTDPGFMLAKKIAKLASDYQNQFGKKPAILFLEKHGLFVTAKTSDAALRLVRKVISLCSSNLKIFNFQFRHTDGGQVSIFNSSIPQGQKINTTKLTIRKGVFDATGQYLPVTYFGKTEAVAAFMSRKDAGKLLATPALNPDELVYANGSAMWIEKCEAERISKKIKAQVGKGQKPPAAFVVKRLGLFVAADKKTAPIVAEITAGSLIIRMNAARFGGILALTNGQQNFINNWESEAFRKQLASAKVSGELQNRIAVVTGAGSGLGRSIAIGLAKAGAMVALVDIDKKAEEETELKIRNPKSEIRNLPNGSQDFQTMVVGCDVTNEADVQRAFAAVLESWGGLDILVNAAGVAPAYALVDMPVEKWRFALEVNLTGYFLMAKYAAKIMIQQGMRGNIINLSSKSGLDASKNNTAYNATKAGEIHIARGWALELGEYGIRVNAVAPGNVFEGSKIWNPQYIKTCAEKYGIKPEEVIPFYVGRTALNREIKGQDVADAVVFLCSDRARTVTGQTLVPDSGQVMVR
jgi:NAD(P)-dependent dehydrogenase (short-subunit alcohol dehydrogenase family)/rhamnose utilization protein RhaD (predicted bifunctional aldolase and dehydrogenase)